MAAESPLSPLSLPTYLSSYTHPGMRFPLLELNKDGQIEVIKLRSLPAEALEALKSLKGREVHVIDADPRGLNCLDAGLHEKTLEIVSKCTQIQGFDLKNWTYDQFQRFLCTLNSQLRGKRIDSLRQDNMFVFKVPDIASISQDASRFQKYLKENDPAALPSYKEFLQAQPAFCKELECRDDLESPIEQSEVLSPSVKAFAQKYFSLCTSPIHLEKLMRKFFVELKKMIRQNQAPIEIAAFAKVKICQLHPFEDANGRLSRLIMNCILMQMGELPPVYFYSNDEYTTVVQDSLLDYRKFAEYLSRKVHSFWELREVARRLFPSKQEQDLFMERAGVATVSLSSLPKFEDEVDSKETA